MSWLRAFLLGDILDRLEALERQMWGARKPMSSRELLPKLRDAAYRAALHRVEGRGN